MTGIFAMPVYARFNPVCSNFTQLNLYNVKPEGLVGLTLTDRDGKKKEKLGYVVACPQDLVSNVYNGKLDCDIYKSPEFMTDIYFLPTNDSPSAAIKNDVEAARTRYKTRYVAGRGCGHVSKNVSIWTVSQTKDNWQAAHYDGATKYYALVPNGRREADEWLPDDIWISKAEWNKKAEIIKDILKDIPDRMPKEGKPASTR
jgi:hypothetical protein